MQDVSDTAIGCFWLHPVLTAFGEPTIPYMFSRIEWLVPCPTAALRVEKIKAMFARSVWLLMIMVLILTSLLFRSIAQASDYYCRINSNAKISLSDCFQSTWAIFLSMPVQKLPENNILTSVLFIYV